MVYSVLNGIGGCLINTPCIASIGHWFLDKRGNATGVAMTAGSIGGIIFPLMLQKLLPTVGFPWATRILGFILLFLLLIMVNQFSIINKLFLSCEPKLFPQLEYEGNWVSSDLLLKQFLAHKVVFES